MPRYSIIEKRNSENNQIIRREEQRRFYDEEGNEIKREIEGARVEPILVYFLGKPGMQETLVFKKGGRNEQGETTRGSIIRWEMEEPVVTDSGEKRKSVIDFEYGKQFIYIISEDGEPRVEDGKGISDIKIEELKRFVGASKIGQIEKREKKIKPPKPEDYLQKV